MDQSTKINITKAVKQYIADTGISQTELANKAGIRVEYMSHILNQKFNIPTGNGKTVTIADKYFNRLKNFIGYNQQPYWEPKPTPQLTAMLAIMNEAREYGYTRIITGETGAGKTYTAQLFLRKYPADTFVITVGSTDNLNDLIDKIIEKLNITSGKTKSKKLRDIARKLRQLKEDGYHPTIIFDEAEYMKQPALASMKYLFDAINGYAALLLIGTGQLLDNINRLRRKDKPGIPQLYRRIKFGIRRLNNIDRSFKLFLNEIEDPQVRKYIRQIADNYGELHDILVPVRREADRLQEPISVSLIQKVLNLSTDGF